MGKCPNCGRGKWGKDIKTSKCLSCGTDCCEVCGLLMLWIGGEGDLRACSKECSQRFGQSILALAQKIPFPIGTDMSEFNIAEDKWWNMVCIRAIGKAHPAVSDRYNASVLQGSPKQILVLAHAEELRNKFRHKAIQLLAGNLEATGRFLDAAEIYEKHMRLYEKARALREKEKQVTIRKIDVSVDLNEMIRQVRESGIVVVYRCPHCGGKLKIGGDTSVSSLKTCEHCGSEIETVDLADFLKTALS